MKGIYTIDISDEVDGPAWLLIPVHGLPQEGPITPYTGIWGKRDFMMGFHGLSCVHLGSLGGLFRAEVESDQGDGLQNPGWRFRGRSVDP